MAELETEVIADVEALTTEQLVEHTSNVLVLAEETLKRVNASEVFPSFAMGCGTLKRAGKPRQVHYVETGDGRSPRLRIEVYLV